MPKGEDEEKAELEHQTDNLAQKAEAANRLELKEKYEAKIAVMKNGLENGKMSEEDTVFVRAALAKFEKKLADLMLLINEDNNKAQLMLNESKENDEAIAEE